MLRWLIIPIMVLGTLMTATGIVAYCFFKYRQNKTKPKFLSAAWHRNDTKNNKEVQAMLPNHLNNLQSPPK